MFGFMKQIFIAFLAVGGSLGTKCVFSSNQTCLNRPTLTDLNAPDGLHYSLFVVTLDRCDGSCNTSNNLYNKINFPNKTKNVRLRIFNMIMGIKEKRNIKY